MTDRYRPPKLTRISPALAGLLAAATTPAWTQTQDASGAALEEIIVTAQKREQNIQDVGISITALNGEQLTQLGIRDTDTIANMTPGLVASSLGSQGISTFTLRGVSQNDFADQNEAPIAVYFDGAYNSFIGGVGAAMYDVDRVEVLRGPQGTLFGRNATGGLIQIISRKPTREFQGYAEINAGENSLREFQGAISGSLSDTWRARLAVETRRDDGYIRNTLGGDLQGANNFSARLQVEWLPADNFNVLFNLHGAHDNVDRANGYHAVRAISVNGLVTNPTSQGQYAAFCNAAFGANTPVPLVLTSTSACSGAQLSSDPFVASLDNPGLMKRNTYGATVTATANLSDTLSLVSISDYLKLKRDGSNDTDGTAFRQFNFFSNADNYQYSQELRLQGQQDRLNWTAGLFYLDIHDRIQTGIDAAPDLYTLTNANPDTLFPFKTDNSVRQYTESYAVFAQSEIKLLDPLSLIAGARWSEDRKRIEIETSCGEDIFHFACAIVGRPGTVQGDGFNSATNPGLNRENNGEWSGKLELDYRPQKGWLIYGGVNRGVKGGGFNAGAIASITANLTPYRPEVLTSYEVGFKSTLLDGKMRLNSSAFYYNYSNYQAFTLTGLTPTVFNADATVKGSEVELQWNPMRGLELAFGASYLDAIAHDVPLNLLGGRNLGDQHMPQSPTWALNGLVRYGWRVLGGTVAVQTDARYVGKRYFNTVNHPALTDSGYTVVDGRLSYTSGDDHWEVALWGRNLTNREYATMAFDLTTTNGTVVQAVAPPRWIGGSVSYRW